MKTNQSLVVSSDQSRKCSDAEHFRKISRPLKMLRTIGMSKLVACALICGVMVSVPAPVYAHHSHASLNLNATKTWEGTIAEYIWKSPHLYIKANVKNDEGELVEYTIEALNPPSMASLGWGPDTFKQGDYIKWEGNPDRDPNRAYSGINWAEKSDGTRLAATSKAIINARKKVDKNEVVVPATKIGEGMWVRSAADGGRFPPIYAPSDDWPLNAKGKEVVANFSEDDNPIKKCIYTGPPRAIVSLLGFKWDRPTEDTITIHRDLWPHPRVIHLKASADEGTPTTFGYSKGHFEGDDLVVETDNFVAEKWGNYTGIDSSAEKSLTERYSLSKDGKMLNVDVVVTDPVYLSKPYAFTHHWRKIADRPLTDAECTLDNANLYLTAGYDDPIKPSSEAPQAKRKAFNPILLLGLGFIIFLIIMAVISRKRRKTNADD